MENADEIKQMVKQKYSEIALLGNESGKSSCSGSSCCSSEVYNIMTDDYAAVEGYSPDADLNLGCGLPTLFAKIGKGDTVVDLGSGAGNDCFIARHETGERGKVIGIDFTEAMIAKARINAEKKGFTNVEFRLGDIEDIPVTDNMVDVVVSNCVMNLVPDKMKAFSEIYRILRTGGHFSISDIVLVGNLPEKLQSAVEMYAGCVAGAIQKEDYLAIIRDAGFSEITIQKEKPIIIPDDILQKYVNEEEVRSYQSSPNRIFSITLYAEKPEKCCGRGCCF